MKLQEALPGFYNEILQLLKKRRLTELIRQLPELEVSSRCDCGEFNCSTFEVTSDRELSIIENNIIRTHCSESIDIDTSEGMVVVDIDNFGIIKGFEILNRDDVFKSLNELYKNDA